MPMLTGYGNDMPEQTQEAPSTGAPFDSQRGIVDDPNAPMPSMGGRTGADVIAAALAQPTLRTGDPKAQAVDNMSTEPRIGGTTGMQGEMEYGFDAGYGA